MSQTSSGAHAGAIVPGWVMLNKLSGLLLLLTAFWISPSSAQDFTEKVVGETIYVPAYSRIFSYPNRSDLLAATLAVHNVDPETALTLMRVDYHGLV